jgi:hypothetical protein
VSKEKKRRCDESRERREDIMEARVKLGTPNPNGLATILGLKYIIAF